MLNKVELDFVSEGVLRYPGVNSKLFSDKVKVETKEEAEDRVYRTIASGKSKKDLAEYAKALARVDYPEIKLKKDIFQCTTVAEDDRVLESVAVNLINQIPELDAAAAALAEMAEEAKKEEEKAKEKQQYDEYIGKISVAREVLEKEAKDAGFGSLKTYLMFLDVFGSESTPNKGKVEDRVLKSRFGIE